MLLPDSQMESLGAESFSQMKKEVPISKDPVMNAYVQCVSKAIVEASKGQLGNRSWEVVVFNSQDVNAFALPGGKIGVYTGLMKAAKSPDQLAAVLGHEVGHVIARHGNERMSAALATQGGLLVAGEALANKENKGLIMGALGLGAQFGVLLPHGRAQESESDEIGLDLMARAGFNPKESVELWKNMSAVAGGSPPEWLSTHPSNSSRINHLQSLMPKALAAYEAALKARPAPACRL